MDYLMEWPGRQWKLRPTGIEEWQFMEDGNAQSRTLREGLEGEGSGGEGKCWLGLSTLWRGSQDAAL